MVKPIARRGMRLNPRTEVVLSKLVSPIAISVQFHPSTTTSNHVPFDGVNVSLEIRKNDVGFSEI